MQQSQPRPSRNIQACLECRKSKLKCDGMLKADSTCTRCQKRGKKCTWTHQLPIAISVVDGTQNQSTDAVGQTSFSIPSPGKLIQSEHYRNQHESPNHFNDSGPSHHSSPASSRKRIWEGEDNTPGKRFPTQHSLAQQRIRHATSWSRRRSSRSSSPTFSNGLDSAIISRDQSRSPDPALAETTAPAPMVSLREVALYSPEENEDISSAEQANTSTKKSQSASNNQSERKQKFDAIFVEMQNLQQQQGWTRDSITEASAERRKYFESAIMQEPKDLEKFDPLATGLIDEQDCERLFEIYYNFIHTQHGMSDPSVETWQVVRKRSRALFITKIACSAAVDRHERSREKRQALLNCMEEVVTRLLLANAKSADIVKVFILSYLFVQKTDSAADDRCWLLVDAANRAAAELGLGVRLRSSRVSIFDTDQFVDRNEERAWICSLVMQRSLGTSTGQWTLSKLDVKWDKLEAWCESKMALPGDVQLVGYLFLRRIEHQARSDFERLDRDRLMTFESIRVGFNALFDNWQRRWVEHPRLVGNEFVRNFLKTIKMHIQLLLNITALKLAESGRRRKRHSSSRDIPEEGHEQCVRMASELCTHFLSSFQVQTKYLCRNIVSMVVWGAMALIQMEPEKGRLLALKVALLLAGDASDTDFRANLSTFYGRILLSMINDLAVGTGGMHRKRSLSTHRGRQRTKDHQGQHGKMSNSTSGRTNTGNGIKDNLSSASITSASPAPRSFSSDTPRTENLYDRNGSGGGVGMGEGANQDSHIQEQMWSAEKMLSSMALPLSADPFNEAWLNQFLDNIAPAPGPMTWQDLQPPFPNTGPGGMGNSANYAAQSNAVAAPALDQTTYPTTNNNTAPGFNLPNSSTMQMF